MSARFWFVLPVLAIAAAVPVRPVASPPPAAATAQDGNTTTLDDQAELAVTIYNSDIALVGTCATSRSPGERPTCISWTSRPP